MTNPIKLVRAVTLAGVLSVVPLAVDKTSENPGLAGFSVTPSVACAQADECSLSLFKICSTHNGDRRFYRCSKGCEEPGEEEEKK